MPQMISDREFASEILRLDDIYILTHAHPDGDTVGTGIALSNALCALGKRAALVCGDSLSHHLEFMRDFSECGELYFGNLSDVPFEARHIVSVDVASAGLLSGTLSALAERIELALDHHEINTLPCQKLFVEPTSSSAGETLFGVLAEMEKLSGKKLLSQKTASALYCAIASDSGNFQYQSTTGRTFRIAAALLDCGVQNAEIARRLFDTQPFSVFRAEALCTEHARFFRDGKIAFSYRTIEDCRERLIPDSDFETCVQLLRRIEGVEVSIFAKEKELSEEGKSRFRVSLRSNEYVNVADVCAAFTGGGHARAAGCTIEGTVDDVAEKLIAEIEKQLL